MMIINNHKILVGISSSTRLFHSIECTCAGLGMETRELLRQIEHMWETAGAGLALEEFIIKLGYDRYT